MCVKHFDFDIIGVSETHLRGLEQFEVDGYEWYGQNRTLLSSRATSGSGGVGVFIKKTFTKNFNISRLDDSHEGILWIKCASKTNNSVLLLCTCYLPPEGSSRCVNPEEFFDTLLTQVYTYQQHGQFYICGDFNSRCGHMLDYIEGVDEGMCERSVIDHTVNKYGHLFVNFLISSNCCIVNGRNTVENDFTSISPKGLSVVDYVIVPYEELANSSKFTVTRASAAYDAAGCVGVTDPTRVIPDHSILSWQWDIHQPARGETDSNGHEESAHVATRAVYDKPNTSGLIK